MFIVEKNTDIDKVGRQTALKLQSLMAIVEYDFNRHEPCLVCGEKYFKHYPDGLPCETDTDIKDLYSKDRWGNKKILKNPKKI